MLLLFYFLLISQSVFAKPIRITRISSLDFGIGVPGDGPKTVAPSTVETTTNGSFQITGDANRSYSISLPASATLRYRTGGRTYTITVNNFTSSPSANGLLSASGSQTLFVGATRAALANNQMAGSYAGTYAVTVVY